ncbi:DUF2971 domain-containing protein [Alkalibacillus haloalkaliphilus]|uniref:DUF2971 domain-containing protein n=1 Tax=Alkalibacillus haloalkaliphilus TaxID=94136 RepID=UPI0002E901EC|nr:DUF2971 domain-containing protein [Alkalibacillus haloalkaliphilus]
MNIKDQKYINENPIDYVKILKALDRFPQDVFNTIYKIIKLYVPDEIFKYYSLTDNENLNNLKFSTLENREIHLSNARDFNDPFDNRSYYFDVERLKKYKFGYFFGEGFVKENINKTRLASFSKSGVNNLPMWAHYSNNHQGYCVSYSTDLAKNPELSPSLFPVQYLEKRIDVTTYFIGFLRSIEENYEQAIKEKQDKILIDNLMLLWVLILSCYIKEEKWEYEQEFRVMKPTNVSRPEYMKANPSAIYIGDKCKDEHIFRLVNIAFTLNIPVYKMEMNLTSFDFQLVPKQIYI